jgi:hypothetical protein
VQAISIQQPWAWAIVHAGKDVENRTWNTRYRGPLAIHASATLQPDCAWPLGTPRPDKNVLQLSAIIGVVDFVDVVTRSASKWFSGPFGFLLANPRSLFRPVPCKGDVGVWTIPPDILSRVQSQLTGDAVTQPHYSESPNAVRQKSYDVAAIRRDYNQAYLPWSAQDDAYLEQRFLEGASIDDLVLEFGRKPGGIRSRLRKLGFDPRSASRRSAAPRTDSPPPQENGTVEVKWWRASRPNAGRVWSPQDDEQLLREYDAGTPIKEIAKTLGRGVFSLEVRLCKLGRIPGK